MRNSGVFGPGGHGGLRPHRRRASVYVFVLAAGVMLAVIGVAALKVTRINTRMVSGTNDIREADLLAFSGVEHALAIVRESPNSWRNWTSSGTEFASAPLGSGTVSAMFVDEVDGDLWDDDADAVRVYGIGRVGDVVRAYSILLGPRGDGFDSLGVAMYCRQSITFDTGVFDISGTAAAGTNVIATSATVNGDVEASGTITGGLYAGEQSAGVPTRTLPDVNTVFDYYMTNGTHIAYGDLPNSGSGKAIQNRLLSPVTNPYGSGQTNDRGIYVIDCGGASLRVQYARIVGTLVVRNAAWVDVMNSVHWEPAQPNLPALVVEGDVKLLFDSTIEMAEFDVGMNLNPAGAPYQGDSDAAIDDSYPCIMRGVIYSTGALIIDDNAKIEGVLLGNSQCGLKTSVDLTYEGRFLTDPPPGFGTVDRFGPIPGSWQRTSLPE